LRGDVQPLRLALLPDEAARDQRRQRVQDLARHRVHALVAVADRGGQVVRHRVVRARQREIQHRRVAQQRRELGHPVRTERGWRWRRVSSGSMDRRKRRGQRQKLHRANKVRELQCSSYLRAILCS